MEKFIIPKDYHSELNLHDTQIAIKTVKDFFQNLLSQRLNLSRVSAPLFVDPDSGLNDNLNGVERPVTFDIKEQNGREAEVVQSLAKWKRYALKKYGFSYGEGLYTDMNAIRRDEITDNIHSIFVDQWDWEKIIKKDERTIATLMDTVKVVYKCLRVKDWINSSFEVVQVRDYLRHPKPSGYRSLHVIIKVDGCLVEIQVRTIALDFWANLEHQIHYKKDIEDEKLIRSELKRCADEIASLDLSFQTIKDRIEG